MDKLNKQEYTAQYEGYKFSTQPYEKMHLRNTGR